MKILLLEDDLMLNQTIKEFLESQGNIIIETFDGKEAIKIVEKEKFDLLILDINVPSVDGLTLLENLHVKKIYIPTIYISALVDIEDISRAFNLGCYDYLKKPFHLQELSLRIKKLIALKEKPSLHVKLSSNYTYNIQSKTLYFNKEIQILSKKQQEIIDVLAKNIGSVVNFEMFRIYVWDEAIIDNATIRTEVNRLKKILKEDFILNIRAIGYMIER